MSRALYLIQQAFTSLRRNALVVAAAILAVFVSLTLAFGALVVNELFQVNTTRWQEGVHVVVFMKDDVSQDAQLDLQREIQSWDEVDETSYCDKTCAWLEFKGMFADQPALLEETDASILPASIRIKLTDVNYYRDITFRLLDNAAVRKTVTAGERFDQLSSISNILNALGLGLAILLGAASVVLIANTIRMAIYARRDEVSVMRLVGASNWFIRIPFLLEGMLQGLVGAALAVAAVWAGHSFLAGLEPEDFLIRLSVGNDFLVQWGVLILLFGAGAGIVGSAFGLRRFLKV
ncbi:MAG: permease-like cell division protein FtsX [Acidimicrobiia bacterium]|nr:permease-like cell division protein FtsX [Acidimicrobiia bacterium]MDH3396915.1 permease-like cell division protein FtsX [Acidimicrobiia bacterium]